MSMAFSNRSGVVHSRQRYPSLTACRIWSRDSFAVANGGTTEKQGHRFIYNIVAGIDGCSMVANLPIKTINLSMPRFTPVSKRQSAPRINENGHDSRRPCQDAPLLAVGRNGILFRGLGGHDSPNIIDRFLLKAPLLAAGMFTGTLGSAAKGTPDLRHHLPRAAMC
jgi:hypothetical protein